MKSVNMLLTGSLVYVGFLCGKIFSKRTTGNLVLTKPEAFLEKAISQGIATIETAKLALQISLSAELKEFARQMIDDHTIINQGLVALAKSKNLALMDDAQLVENSGQFLLKYNEIGPFDSIYITHQLGSLKHTITLFRKAINSEDVDIKRFSRMTLHRLEHQLEKAQELEIAVKTQSLNATPSSDLDQDRRP